MVTELTKNPFKDKTLSDLASDISNYIRNINKQLDQKERNIISRHKVKGVTPPQLFVLRILWMEDEIALKYLASLAKVSRPTMTGIIDTMEKNRLVTRISNPNDKRSTLVKLTTKGNDLKVYKPPLDSNILKYFEDFTPEEIESLYLLLEKLSNSIEKI